VPNIGPIKAKNLIRHCGSAENVFTERKNLLLKIPDIGEAIVKSIANSQVFERAENELRFAEQNRIDILSFQDDKFPQRLLHCPDHPLVLYKEGNVDLNSVYIISVVGTRAATPYGKELTHNLIEHLKEYPVLVVSGLAYGIDVTAHSACIKHNIPTVGVIAHGLDQIYPKDHDVIAHKMTNNGALLTEFLSKSPPDKENFPKRNRVVAGMADATIVIESQAKGGALITAKLAADYNRDVFAAPGRVGDPFSIGCLDLIEKNLAAVYCNPKRLTTNLGWKKEGGESKKSAQISLLIDLTPEEELIVTALKKAPKQRKDQLSLELGKPVSQLSATLLGLELKGAIVALPGGVFDLSITAN
jgi:DNA processing protein